MKEMSLTGSKSLSIENIKKISNNGTNDLKIPNVKTLESKISLESPSLIADLAASDSRDSTAE